VGALIAVGYAMLSEVNLVYARFFHAMLPRSSAVDLRSALELTASAWSLVRWPDAVGMLVAVGLAAVSARQNDGIRRRRLVAALIATGVLALLLLGSLRLPVPPGYALSRTNVLIAWAQSLGTNSVLGEELPVHDDWRDPDAVRRDLLSDAVAGYEADIRFPLAHLHRGDPALANQVRARAGNRPINVVMIILESVRAYETFELPGPRPLPVLERLSARGLHAREAYAASFLSIRGMFAIQCGYYPNPSGQAIATVLPDLRVPCLPAILRAHGYDTLWEYGVPKSFQNEGVFAQAHGFSQIDDEASFPADTPHIALGVNDVALFHSAVAHFDDAHEPFFGTITTDSSHHPFLARGTHRSFGFRGEYEHYLESLNYLNDAIEGFLAEARTRPWFDHTVFIFVADHGVPVLPQPEEVAKAGLGGGLLMHARLFSRIPLILYAPKLIDAAQVEAPATQLDLAPTVLDLTGVDAEGVFVGHSLFSLHSDRSLLVIGFGQLNAIRGRLRCWDLDVPTCELAQSTAVLAPTVKMRAPELIEWGKRAAGLAQFYVRTDRLVPLEPTLAPMSSHAQRAIR